MVSGPGQKRAASVRAASGTSVQHFSKASGPGTMRERGFTSGRPLTSYMRSTAASSKPLPARP